MLAITVKKGDEPVVVGGNIKFFYVEGGSEQIKIAIDAPKHISIHRPDVIKREPRR